MAVRDHWLSPKELVFYTALLTCLLGLQYRALRYSLLRLIFKVHLRCNLSPSFPDIVRTVVGNMTKKTEKQTEDTYGGIK